MVIEVHDVDQALFPIRWSISFRLQKESGIDHVDWDTL